MDSCGYLGGKWSLWPWGLLVEHVDSAHLQMKTQCIELNCIPRAHSERQCNLASFWQLCLVSLSLSFLVCSRTIHIAFIIMKHGPRSPHSQYVCHLHCILICTTMASCRGAWLHPLATVAGSCCGIHLDDCTHHHGGVVRDDAHTVPPVLFDILVCNTSAIFWNCYGIW